MSSSPMRLHQLLAVEKDIKNEALRVLTAFYQKIEKNPLLSGISRRYRPVTEEGEKLPPESTIVQLRVEETLPEVQKALTALFDLVLAKEDANQGAKADIVVDGVTIMAGVPVCALLFLEKQVTDIATLVDKLPVLDPSERWEKDAAQNCWATSPVETHRTKKIPRPFIKSPATDKHPAQVEVVHEDEVVGYWSTTKFSGSIPADRKAALKTRVAKLRQAIKVAREDANTARDVARAGTRPSSCRASSAAAGGSRSAAAVSMNSTATSRPTESAPTAACSSGPPTRPSDGWTDSPRRVPTVRRQRVDRTRSSPGSWLTDHRLCS